MNDYNRGVLPDPCLRLDYGFGKEWASVELGDGTGYVRLADYEKSVAENAKLRELVSMYSQYTDQDRCEGCVLKRSCNDGEIDECWQIAEIREMEKELGVLGE